MIIGASVYILLAAVTASVGENTRPIIEGVTRLANSPVLEHALKVRGSQLFVRKYYL